MYCARCRRPISKAVIVAGDGYGKDCAVKVGDLLVQPAQRAVTKPRRARRRDERQMTLEVRP